MAFFAVSYYLINFIALFKLDFDISHQVGQLTLSRLRQGHNIHCLVNPVDQRNAWYANHL